jgi:hypothetical protein
MDEILHFGIPGGSGDFHDEGDECDKHDAILSASRRHWAAIDLQRFDLGTSEVDGYESEDGDNVHADEEEVALQADDGSTQNVDD